MPYILVLGVRACMKPKQVQENGEVKIHVAQHVSTEKDIPESIFNEFS